MHLLTLGAQSTAHAAYHAELLTGPEGLAPAALSQASLPVPPLVLPDSVQVALSGGPFLPLPPFGLGVCLLRVKVLMLVGASVSPSLGLVAPGVPDSI